MTNFEELFESRPEAEASAHGRINLVGEHTDYNSGLALPTCISQTTNVYLRARDDDKVRGLSLNMQASKRSFEYVLGSEYRRHHWSDSVQGLTVALKREGFRISGFDCLIDSDIPMGSGLASGAAMEVALLKGLNELFGLNLNDLRVADLARRAENDFLGTRFGIMNPMAASLGQMNEALFIDTSDLQYERLPLPVDRMELIVINSGMNHSHWNQGHKERRAECEEACELLGVRDLRQLEVSDLARLHEQLPDHLMRRVRHVITENDRVLEAVEAIEKRQVHRLGEVLNLSHLSLKQDYAVSLPEIDLLVKISLAHEEVFGGRLMGSGFGGSVVLIAKPGVAMRITEHIQDEYHRRTGLFASVLVPPLALMTERRDSRAQQWLI